MRRPAGTRLVHASDRPTASVDRADVVMMSFARAQQAEVDVESHTGDSITGDLMTKSW
jgi:hypothetical protein